MNIASVILDGTLVLRTEISLPIAAPREHRNQSADNNGLVNKVDRIVRFAGQL
jgi:hypothetical protein